MKHSSTLFCGHAILTITLQTRHESRFGFLHQWPLYRCRKAYSVLSVSLSVDHSNRRKSKKVSVPPSLDCDRIEFCITMPIIAGLLAVGVSLAIDKYQERQSSSSRRTEARNNWVESQDQETSFETGLITSDDADRRREQDAFNELQHYADFQNNLSSKVLDELSREESLSVQQSPNYLESNTNMRSTPQYWYDPTSGSRYETQGRLTCPIVISQRGPGNGPGWVRTYALSLMECGITQRPFLKFLDAFNESILLSPYVEAVNIAALESGIGWRDKTTNLSTAMPIAVRLAKAGQARREHNSFLDHANMSFFSPHGLFAMVIITTANDLSQIINIDLNTGFPSSNIANGVQGSTFNEMNNQSQSHAVYTQPDASPARPTNKLRKMSNFIADYGDRRANSQSHINSFAPTFYPQATPTSTGPLFSLISNISNTREIKKESRRRRRRRGSNNNNSSRPNGVLASALEGAFRGGRVGKPSLAGAARGLMDRMGREDVNDDGQARDAGDVAIEPGAVYLVIVNDPGNDMTTTQGETFGDSTFNIDPELGKGKKREAEWFEENDSDETLFRSKDFDQEHQDQEMEGIDDLPPEYTPEIPHKSERRTQRAAILQFDAVN